MPSEIRNIVFSDDELLEAIRQYNARANKKLPQGQFVRCRPTGGDVVGAVVEIDDAMGDGTKRVTLDQSYIVAVLINACLRSGIPLPRRARKSLQTVGPGVALHLSLPHKDPSRSAKSCTAMPVPKDKRVRVW